jgi:hypothetical protein
MELSPSAKIFWPLKVACLEMRSISASRSSTSREMALRSEVLFEPLAACTASSRMRWIWSLSEASEPSAVCSMDTPSLALRMACDMPRIWVVMREVIAMPAASSAAELMRRPDDSRCNERARSLPLERRFLCADIAGRFVLIDRAIASFTSTDTRRRSRGIAGVSASSITLTTAS